MILLSGNRALRLIFQSRYWRNHRYTTVSCTQAVHHPCSHQHRCTSQSSTSTKPSTGEVNNADAPIQYTSSKAHNWSVHNSFGRHKKRPWYKVAPISITLTIFLAWVFLREETDIDRELEKHLHERLPNLFKDPAESLEVAVTDDASLNDEDIDNLSKQ